MIQDDEAMNVFTHSGQKVPASRLDRAEHRHALNLVQVGIRSDENESSCVRTSSGVTRSDDDLTARVFTKIQWIVFFDLPGDLGSDALSMLLSLVYLSLGQYQLCQHRIHYDWGDIHEPSRGATWDDNW